VDFPVLPICCAGTDAIPLQYAAQSSRTQLLRTRDADE
jgi:hypothetical protein